MPTITLGADVDVSSKKLKVDPTKVNRSSAWTDISGTHAEAADSDGLYDLAGALSSLKAYAATVGPSTDVSGLVSETEMSYKTSSGGWILGDNANDHGLYLKLFNSTASGAKDTFEVYQKNSSGGDTSLFKIECEASS
tara:strand:- start:1298 stop:1711 length:414 start_codon:yes stop_codon:yes gene_type:complete